MICGHCGESIGPHEDYVRLEGASPTGPCVDTHVRIHHACVLPAMTSTLERKPHLVPAGRSLRGADDEA